MRNNSVVIKIIKTNSLKESIKALDYVIKYYTQAKYEVDYYSYVRNNYEKYKNFEVYVWDDGYWTAGFEINYIMSISKELVDDWELSIKNAKVISFRELKLERIINGKI